MKKIYYIVGMMLALSAGMGCKSTGKEEKPLDPRAGLRDTLDMDSLNTGLKKYDMKSGILIYTASMVGKVSKTIDTSYWYFDDYGAKQAKISNHGKSMVIEKLGFTWSINLADSQGTKMLNTLNSGFNPDGVDFKNIPENTKTNLQVRKAGKEKFMDRECDIYTMSAGEMGIKAKIWTYKYVKMKIELDKPASKIACYKIEEDVAVDPKYFEIPEGMKITTISK